MKEKKKKKKEEKEEEEVYEITPKGLIYYYFLKYDIQNDQLIDDILDGLELQCRRKFSEGYPAIIKTDEGWIFASVEKK